MLANSLYRPLVRRTTPWICDRCALRLESSRPRRRWTSTHSASDASRQNTGIVDILERRGYLNQITGTRDDLQRILDGKRIGAYVGVDPTASSMHVGHLIPFMALFWLYLHGHKAITLVGGGTASVGDPTGRVKARPHLSAAARRRNIDGIQAQLQRIWGNVSRLGAKHGQRVGEGEARLLNNEDWLGKTSILDVLGTVGAGLRLGVMLGRDTVKTRMTADASTQEGMSFAEFCYPVLQAWDWYVMFRDHDVRVQIGGSDQYGNILSGADGIKYALKVREDEGDSGALDAHPLGFTVPLLTTPSGEKFGKSAGNAVWLDKEQTSVFDLYGFFVGLPDSEVEKLLNFFTFLPQGTISDTMAKHNLAPEKRIAQHLLAREFVELVHGPEDAAAAQDQHLSRSRGYTPASKADLQVAYAEVTDKPFAFALHMAGLAESRSKALKLIESGGAYVIGGNGDAVKIRKGDVVSDAHYFTKEDEKTPSRRFLVLRAGKWKVRSLELV
ncbi:tyrosine-tRNA ligase [Verruconis gallopava]|uniref:Tyrosine--tRNA ligase n=1 Tax=Verruconis gallopava TaxID=253628 RepID=A0A0D2A490_9PEZI|nr:tyrosine-tRNA ligase [Verruconis gallopava]KIW01603.1 tyrosine-tRNA ligase [Verruconis gallopava]